jgi:Ni/Fe-hydrogenase subunit HybB-like protein
MWASPALEASSGTHYVPRWSEIAMTLAIVAAGFAIFRIVAEYFPVFEAQAREPAFSEAEKRR